ncbi:MAG TPA: amidohydrolase family protein [Acidimicrobiales bacterium]|nr:amidohydrolase family protein [Acidimicrobiales bacterium]
MQVVDLHHHFMPLNVLEQLRIVSGGKARLINEKISIALNPDLADGEAHLEAMDQAGVDVAVLTQSGLSVLGDKICRDINEGMAAVAEQWPSRFIPTAHICIDDQNAARELESCVEQYGFGAVALPCSSPERQLDDPSLGPLWAVIENLDIPIILHPAQLPNGASLDYALERSCYRPFDTTVAGVRLFNGVLPQHPGLKFVLPHCGGTIVGLKGRLAMFFERPGIALHRLLPRTRAEQRAEGLDTIFEQFWAKLYFDTAGTGAWSPIVEFATGLVGADHMAFGTDYPLESHSGETMRELVEMIENLELSTEQRAQIASGTALDLLGLPLEQALSARS